MNEKNFMDKDILHYLLSYFQLNIAQFSTKIRVEKQRLYDLNVGKSANFTREILNGIAENCPEINLYWVLTGHGKPLIDVTGNNNAVANNHSTATVNTTDSETIAKLTAIIEKQTQQITKLIDLLSDTK